MMFISFACGSQSVRLCVPCLMIEGPEHLRNLKFKGWNSHVHREFPRISESTNPSRDNLGREIGRIGGPGHLRLRHMGHGGVLGRLRGDIIIIIIRRRRQIIIIIMIITIIIIIVIIVYLVAICAGFVRDGSSLTTVGMARRTLAGIRRIIML